MEGAKFVNRARELETLEREYAAQRSSLVVIYGRRRVGKTRLISEFIKDKKALMFIATEENEKENRESFKKALADYLDHSLLREVKDLSWEALFQELSRNESEKKKIIVMDEFQYIGKSNKAFPSVFQKIWDSILSNENVMVILCGSVISMMKEQALDYSSPLYGRRTSQINVKQIDFMSYGEFYGPEEQTELVEKYSLTGGVPKYIETLLEFKSFEDKVREVIQNPNSYLYEEPYFLLNKEVPDVGNYFSVLKTIAMGNVKPGDIASELGLSVSNLVHYLKILLDMDVIEREVPVTEKNPQKSKKVMYSIKDNFISFWFKYVYPNRSHIEMGHSEGVVKRVLERAPSEHVSYIYENIAKEYVMRNWYEIKGHGYGKIGKWWDKHEEIDVVGVDEHENRILIGECKYKESKVGFKEYNNLVRKGTLVKWGKAGRKEEYVLFSKNGFKEELILFSNSNDQLTLVEL